MRAIESCKDRERAAKISPGLKQQQHFISPANLVAGIFLGKLSVSREKTHGYADGTGRCSIPGETPRENLDKVGQAYLS